MTIEMRIEDPYKWIIERVIPYAKLPEKAHDHDLGWDLFSAEDTTIGAGETRVISTGLRMKFPLGWGAKIFDRSSVATKLRLFVVAGVIDNGYRGIVKVALFNSMQNCTMDITTGQKIAQLYPLPIIYMPFEEGMVDINTERGEGGFGSSN